MKKFQLFIVLIIVSTTTRAYNAVVDGIEYNLDTISKTATVARFDGHDTYPTSIVIPGSIAVNDNNYSVTSIGNNAFKCCDRLTSVIIPPSVHRIGSYAFEDCNHLETLTLPEGIDTIAWYAFNRCRGLTKIVLPNSLRCLGSFAFAGCQSLISLSFGEGITSLLGEYVFYGCSNLVDIDFGKVNKIGGRVFWNCSALTEIEFPESVESIGYSAFEGCTSLKRIIFSAKMKYIGHSAFRFCSNITDVYCYGQEVLAATSDSFGYRDEFCDNHATLHVPKESLPQYHLYLPWSLFSNIVAIESTNDVGLPSVNSDGQVCFDILGQPISNPRKGIYIIRQKDGLIKKLSLHH